MVVKQGQTNAGSTLGLGCFDLVDAPFEVVRVLLVITIPCCF